MALDGLGEKLKSFFKSKDDPRFKGQGRRLGTAETPSLGPKPTQPVADGGRSANKPTTADLSTPQAEAPTPLKPPPQPLGAGGRPALVLSRSHRTEDVVLDVAVMANTPTGKEAHLVSAHKPRSADRGASHLGPGSSLSSNPASPPQRSGPCSPTTAGGGGAVVDGLPELKLDVQRTSGGGVGRRQPAAGAVGGRGRSPSWGPGGALSSMVSTISTPTAAEKRMGGFRCPAPPTDGAMADYGLAPATSQAYELQRCLALVLSSRPLSNSNISTDSSIQAPVSGAVASGPLPRPGPSPLGAASAPAPPADLAAAEQRAASAEAVNAAGEPDAACAVSEAATPMSLNPLASSTLSSSLLASAASTSNVEVQPAVVAPERSSAPTGDTAGGGGGAAAEGAGSVTGGGGGGGGGGGTAVAPSGVAVAPGTGVAGPRECCDALMRVLRNVLTRPEEPKFRQIRLSNPKVQETIVNVPGAVEFLEATGFTMQFQPDDGSETANQGFLVLPDEVAPTALAEAFRILSSVMAAHGFVAAPAAPAEAAAAGGSLLQPQPTTTPPRPQASALGSTSSSTTAPAGIPAPAVERCTQVLLPAAPDVEVPAWFFERTGAEIREQWAAMLRKREDQERFMTKTMREVRRQQEAAAAAAAAVAGGADGAVTGPAGNVATVRVRFPEGVCLQGHFGAAEPVSRVFEWVADSLRSPSLTFELIKPDRRPLETTTTAAAAAAAARGGRSTGAAATAPPRGGSSAAVPLTVRTADMLPSILLNLRPTGQEAAALAAANVPLLSDALLRTTKPQ